MFHYSTYNSVITAISYHQSQKSLGKVAAAAAAIPDTAMEDPLQIKVMPKREEMGRENSFPKVRSIKTTVWLFHIGDYPIWGYFSRLHGVISPQARVNFDLPSGSQWQCWSSCAAGGATTAGEAPSVTFRQNGRRRLLESIPTSSASQDLSPKRR